VDDSVTHALRSTYARATRDSPGSGGKGFPGKKANEGRRCVGEILWLPMDSVVEFRELIFVGYLARPERPE
jgi:hypothetical protein